MRRTLPALVLATVLGAGACASGGPGGAAGPSPSTPSTASPSDTTTRCPSFATDCEERLPPETVELRGILFRPDDLTVDVGATVTFSNLDAVDHTVTAGTPAAPMPQTFDLALADRDDEVAVTLDEPGEIAYFCRIHPDTMRGTITVGDG